MSTCNLTGNVLNSGLEPLDAMLVITLDSVINDDNQAILEKEPFYYKIENGVIDITLEESETKKITYNFQLFVLRDDSPNPIATAVFPEDFVANPTADFHAIVPDLPVYDWDLIRFETGITTQSLSTAAFVVAREMLENDNLVPIINESIGIYRTDIQPTGSPGIIWIDPDTAELFRFSQTYSKFLSPVKSLVIDMNIDNTVYPFEKVITNPLTSDYNEIFIRSYEIIFTQIGTITASDNYTIRSGIIAPNTTTKSIKASIDTDSGVSGQIYRQKLNENVFYNNVTLNQLFLEIIKNNNPGDLIQASVIINYQLSK